MKNLALIAGVSLVLLSPAVPGALQGVVYSADGQPSEGAVVWATITFAKPRIVLETTTDAGGRFALDLFGFASGVVALVLSWECVLWA